MREAEDRKAGKRAEARPEGRPVVYCLVPRALAAKLHEPLRRHFRDDPGVEVVVERRRRERRRAADRRAGEDEPPAGERRTIHSAAGRRVAERRAALVEVERPPLPRRARPYAERLLFLQQVEPTGERLEDLDTARLVTCFQAGDREAFNALYLRYFDRVYGYLRMALNNVHEAEDATQQVFTQVFEALPAYERRRQPFRAWLFVVARHHALERLEKLGRLELMDPAEIGRRRDRPTGDAEELPVLDWISDRDLLLFVERLPLSQRQVLLLRYMLDMSNAQIAAVLRRSHEDVRVLQHRALRFLRQRLAAVGRGPERGDRARMQRRRQQSGVLRLRRFVLD